MKKNSTHLNNLAYKPERIGASDIASLRKQHPELRIVDQYAKNLEELFLLRNPKYRFDRNYQSAFNSFFEKHCKNSPAEVGAWFYYPWLNQLIHFLPDKMHQELRMGRNKNLITLDEQKKFYDATIGVLGMSVGSHVAVVIAMTGGSKHIKIADPDNLSGDNLNRIRNGYQNVGQPKVFAVAHQIYEFNPYAKVEIFKDGLTEKNMDKFLSGLDLLVEEMDNPYMKISVRYTARPLGIPVIMAADNGDGVIADVERYDLNKKLPILHGIVGDMKPEELQKLTPEELPRAIAKIAGADMASNRMLASVAEVGTTLYSWPQLGTAANLCGTVLTYLARQIILKNPQIQSGRFDVNLEAIFEKGYHSSIGKASREKERAIIMRKIGIK